MKTKIALSATFIAVSLFSQSLLAAEPVPARSQATGCEVFKAVLATRNGTRELVSKIDALSMPASEPGRQWLESLRKDARGASQNAEKVVATASQPDPEAVFNLGKQMSSVRDLVVGSRHEAVRPQDAATQSMTLYVDALYKDVYVVLSKAGQIREEAARCTPAQPG